MSSIAAKAIADTPIAVVDIETTGLHPSGDRVVEIAVVRVEPNSSEPRLILDTLVNPLRKMGATEIHGITDADVRDAPTFGEIAPEVASSLNGAVLAAYNVYFDARFVGAELERANVQPVPPHLCLMYMRPLLGLGRRCSLGDACREHDVAHDDQHIAAEDALASARLWLIYLEAMAEMKIKTFGDLAQRKSYKFLNSFADPPVQFAVLQSRSVRKKSRSRNQQAVGAAASSQSRRSEYWDALKAALADLDITAGEIRYLIEKRKQLELTVEDTRALHARAFIGLLATVSDDHLISDEEVAKVAALAEALRKLGWSPGDPAFGPPISALPRRGIISRIFGS